MLEDQKTTTTWQGRILSLVCQLSTLHRRTIWTNNGFNAIFLPLLGLKVAENGSEFSWDPFLRSRDPSEKSMSNAIRGKGIVFLNRHTIKLMLSIAAKREEGGIDRQILGLLTRLGKQIMTSQSAVPRTFPFFYF